MKRVLVLPRTCEGFGVKKTVLRTVFSEEREAGTEIRRISVAERRENAKHFRSSPSFLPPVLIFFEIQTAWFQGFFFVLISAARGLIYHILMLNLSVKFASVANDSQ